MIKKPIFSIIIPVRVFTPYLKETLLHLKKQSFKSFEILIITDKISGSASPALKRNLGAKMSRGIYLAFLDDDSYPSPDWLKNAFNLFRNNIAAVCGPCLTPSQDNLLKKASGLVWSSYLGSGGAGTYRNSIKSRRYVDDFPSVNLIIKKSDFDQVHGFDTHHWPGEDTLLCLSLVYQLKKQILYHPKVFVYHHRRDVLIPHLQQITRYALHRGNFARYYPKTSFKIGYLLPSFFFIYLLSLPFLTLFFHLKFLAIPLYFYFLLMLLTFFSFIKKNSFLLSILATLTIPVTHLYYGILFLIGFFTKNLKFTAHQIDKNKNLYLGG
jgi:cellulose synthase/poly-beta-1,6-N-acetylglucosamine synthase-like glycosyltransferase